MIVVVDRRDVVGGVRMKQRCQVLDLLASNCQLAHASAVRRDPVVGTVVVDVEQPTQPAVTCGLDVDRPRRDRQLIDVLRGANGKVPGDAAEMGL